MFKRFNSLFAISVSTCLLFSGCADKAALGITDTFAETNGGTETAGAEPAPELAEVKNISIECSVSLMDLSSDLTRAYGAEKSVEVSSAAVGTDGALASVAEGNCDFALYSGTAEDAAGFEGLTATVIGAEVLTLIAGAEDGRADITEDEIYTLFMGEEPLSFYGADESAAAVGGPVALEAQGSASRVLFEDLFELRGEVNGMLQSLIPETANEFETAPEVFDYVKSNPGAVGVVSGTVMPEGITGLTIDGVSSDSADYAARRDIVLAYKTGSADAEEFTAFMESASAGTVFDNNGIVR